MSYAEVMRDKSGTSLETLDAANTTRLKIWYSKIRDWTKLGEFRLLESLEMLAMVIHPWSRSRGWSG